MKFRGIEILENDKNIKGDLFGRLLSDFFHVLGYQEPRLNIHKTGREIDINCSHRIENKIAIAECKAHSEKIGGSDINKFIGVLDAEKKKFKNSKTHKNFGVEGYFISLSGFKETAIEQEKELNNDRLILIKPEKIIEELVKGRVLVSIEKALTALSHLIKNYILIEEADLLATDNGWVWAFYFSNLNGQKVTHLALVHAEGKLLIKSLAENIVYKDKLSKNIFENLILLNETESEIDREIKLLHAQTKYFKYLENELGQIQFEGLPTDKEAGSVRVNLENIFIPLHLNKTNARNKKDERRIGIGEILHTTNKLAILAKPGGGKSTLIKRIAIAYAFPERRLQIKDNLPNKNWFPVFLRCRELGDKINLSITEIINSIPFRAEISECSESFTYIISKSLQSGNALLLIDGLDEIAEDRNRISFVNQLRIFIATYPSIGIVITSREAGFRVVGGSLATYCENYTVSNLTNEEIEELSIKWHKSIIDDSENTIKEAKKVSEIINKDSRIKVIAENPLLLTTLLFVKRWAGYLPTKKSVLYQEMIKLLLVTWNVEGHEQLDIEEAEPQLAYVAYWMTKNGKQTISEDELKSCLINARIQMPEILGYTKISPTEFINRVESRSSLLIMSGHKRLDSGNVVQVYEFLHLSFQEYLTAKAIVKRFIDQEEAKKKVVDIIKPNINNQYWKEVIPLTSVLLERDTKELVEFLINDSRREAELTRALGHTASLSASLLGSCIANEVQITPEILDRSIEWYAKNRHIVSDNTTNDTILQNKYGTAFRIKVKALYCEEYNDKHISSIGSLLSEIYEKDLRTNNNFSKLLEDLKSNVLEDECSATLGLMGIGWEKIIHSIPIDKEIINSSEVIFQQLSFLLKKNNPNLDYAIYWAIVWCFDAGLFPNNDSLKISFINHLLPKWINEKGFNLRRVSTWALIFLLNPNIRKEDILQVSALEIKIISVIDEKNIDKRNEFDLLVATYLSYLLKIDIKRERIIEIFKINIKEYDRQNENLNLFLKAFDINLNEVEE